MVKVAWDTSHQEFTIEDHYYFSKLRRALASAGVEVMVTEKLEEAKGCDVLVINYPESPFTRDEIEFVESLLRHGARVVVLGYYNNEDDIATTVNSLTRHFGLELLDDEVTDEVNNYEGDKYFVVTSRVHAFNEGVRQVMLACSAPVRALQGAPVVVGEPSARTRSGVEPVMGALVKVGRGELVLLGTCVFWDNYSLDKFDNARFALNLLTLR